MKSVDAGESKRGAEGGRSAGRRAVITVLKVVIAVVGIWFVARMVRWNDTAVVEADADIRQVVFVADTEVRVLEQQVGATGKTVKIQFPDTPVKVRVPTQQGVIEAELVIDAETMVPGGGRLGLDRVMVLGESQLKLDKGERVHEGFRTLVVKASGRWYLLAGAWAILVIPFLVTTIRWRNLMRPQGIDMPLGKCLQLTFVGQFYSIMLPGITGGDLVKIVYAARLTGSKTKSIITVLLDRVIGLVALMVIAGVSAGGQLWLNQRAGRAVDVTLLNVFLMIVGLLAFLGAASTFYFSRRLRRVIGIEWFVETFQKDNARGVSAEEQHAKLEHLFRVVNVLGLAMAVVLAGAAAYLMWGMRGGGGLPWALKNRYLMYGVMGLAGLIGAGALAGLVLHRMLVDRARPAFRKGVDALIHVDETLHVYRGHFGLLAWAFVISVISQLTLPTSAWLSGLAFGMDAPMAYYLAYVPVAVLAASLPISPPQGFGVMDFILYHFFVERGTARAGQAFALAQAVRFLPILWNLVGAYWVVTGSYSRHKLEAEERAMEAV